MVIPNSYGMQVEATQLFSNQSGWTGLSHLVGLGKLHGHLGWNGTIAKNHGDTVGSSANTLRQTSTEGHIHEYEQHNLEYQTCNKRVVFFFGGYNSEFMGVCVRRQCFCPSFWGVIRCIPQTNINMLAITPGSLGLWSAQNTNMNMCSLLPSFFLAKSPKFKGRLHHIPLVLVNSTTIVGIISTFVAHILFWYAAKTSNAWNRRVGNLNRLSNCVLGNKHPPTPCGKSKKYTLKYTFCLGELDSPIFGYFWEHSPHFMFSNPQFSAPFLVVPPRHCLRQRLQQLLGEALSGQHGSSFHQAGGRNHIGRQPILGCTLQGGCQIQNGPRKDLSDLSEQTCWSTGFI